MSRLIFGLLLQFWRKVHNARDVLLQISTAIPVTGTTTGSTRIHFQRVSRIRSQKCWNFRLNLHRQKCRQHKGHELGCKYLVIDKYDFETFNESAHVQRFGEFPPSSEACLLDVSLGRGLSEAQQNKLMPWTWLPLVRKYLNPELLPSEVDHAQVLRLAAVIMLPDAIMM